MEDGKRDKHGFQISKDVQSLYNTYSPIWEKEEAERTRRWENFMDSTFCQRCDIRVTPQQRKAAQLQGLAAWMSEYRDIPCMLSEERCVQVKMLVQAGVPSHMRGDLWRIFLDTKRACVPGYYREQVLKSLGPEGLPALVSGRLSRAKSPSQERNEHGSHPLAADAQSAAHDASAIPAPNVINLWGSQIEKDLTRTFPSHPSMDKDGCAALSRVLNAYAVHNPAVGYCQGMNFIAGLLLLFMPEEDAFWSLVCVVERLLRGYFEEDMIEAQVDQRTFKHLCDQQFPGLARHLASLQVDISFVCSNWFLTAFVNVLPLEAVLRVWDTLLFEMESSVLFRVAAAVVDQNTRELLARSDSVELWTCLQRMPAMCFDTSALVDSALLQYSHITREMLDGIRALYRPAVQTLIAERGARAKAQERQLLSRSVSIAGVVVDRRISVELDADLPLDAAFFPFLERKASLAAQQLATPMQYSGASSTTRRDSEHEGSGGAPSSATLTFPSPEKQSVPRASDFKAPYSITAASSPANARLKHFSCVIARQCHAQQGEHLAGTACDHAPAHRPSRPGSPADSKGHARCHTSHSKPFSRSPPRRAANATQLVVAAYTAAHTIMNKEDSRTGAAASTFQMLHALEREIINQQQQAAETRRQALKVLTAVDNVNAKQHEAAEQTLLSAAAMAADQQATEAAKLRVPEITKLLKEREQQLVEAERALQEERDKMSQLDTVLADLLESQKNWQKAEAPRAVHEHLPSQPSMTEVLGGFLNASLRRLRH